jgi:hypothetical protein
MIRNHWNEWNYWNYSGRIVQAVPVDGVHSTPSFLNLELLNIEPLNA